MSELSQEDDFRLSIMLTEPLHAVRIDESKLLLHALLERGEISFQLNPNCQETRYLKRVREYLSAHALGSPGGYPVFLQRWARMGQIRGDTLAGLLCIGEPEAVVAAAHVPALTLDLARRVWWALPNSEVARQLLRRPDFVASDLGAILADFLIDYLPFEQESRLVVESVALLLQPGLLPEESRMSLWRGAQKHAGYLTGFIKGAPDGLPGEGLEHPALPELQSAFAQHSDNHYARVLLRILDTPGQLYLQAVTRAINSVGDQDTIIALFDAIATYFAVDDTIDRDAQVAACISASAASTDMLNTIRALERYSSESLNDILGRTDAVGSVMRKKLTPVTDPLSLLIRRLRGDAIHG